MPYSYDFDVDHATYEAIRVLNLAPGATTFLGFHRKTKSWERIEALPKSVTERLGAELLAIVHQLSRERGKCNEVGQRLSALSDRLRDHGAL